MERWKLSKKTKMKMSKSHLNMTLSLAARKKISLSNKSRKVTKLTRNKLSNSLKRRWKSGNMTSINFHGMLGKHHSKETKRTLSLFHTGLRHSRKTRKKLSQRNIIHRQAILKEALKFKRLGYRVLIGDLAPRPDIILRKGNKIIAVEIEFNLERNWNVKKYEVCNFFDDIVWIKKKSRVKNLGYCRCCVILK